MMSKCETDTALLLYGPQNFDKYRSITGGKAGYEKVYPLGIAIVSAKLRQNGINTLGMEMTPGIIDRVKRALGSTQAVFISSRYFDTSLALQVITAANDINIPSIVGGYGPSLEHDQFDRSTARVWGEFEHIADEIIEDLLHGKLQPIYDASAKGPYDIQKKYIHPDRSIFPRTLQNQVFKIHAIEWSRGCRKGPGCSFCSPAVLHNKGTIPRQVGDIMDEIDSMQLKPGNYLFSTDENFSFTPRNFQHELVDQLNLRGIRYMTEGTVTPLMKDYEKYGDSSILAKMSPLGKIGGCYSLMYGIDDLVGVIGEAQDKNVNDLQKIVDTFRIFGIPLSLSIVVGLDSHTYPDSFFQIAKILEKISPGHIFLHIATPYRGTTWGDQFFKEGRVFETETLHFNHRRVVATPKNMTVEQLQQGYYWLMKWWYSPARIAEVARANLNPSKVNIMKNHMLSLLLSGVVWNTENFLSVLELQARGLMNRKYQTALDDGYKSWESRFY